MARTLTSPLRCPTCNKIFVTEMREWKRQKKKNPNYLFYCTTACSSASQGSWKSPFVRVLSRAVMASERKNLDLNLTLGYIVNLWFNQKAICAISGVPMVSPANRTKSKPNSGSLDRIDSQKGYVKGNVQWICLSLNFAKYKWTEKEFKNFLKIISLNIAHNEIVQHARKTTVQKRKKISH